MDKSEVNEGYGTGEGVRRAWKEPLERGPSRFVASRIEVARAAKRPDHHVTVGGPALSDMDIQRITVIGGQGWDGRPEPIARLDLELGQVLSVLGPTGSSKTALIDDIALRPSSCARAVFE